MALNILEGDSNGEPQGSVFVSILSSRKMTESREKIILNTELKTISD